ncbi:MAG: type II toxin-antitoxin system RelE/ParE family toxin [Bacteroidia bacterium]|nr:type II toxin-antitoxin system RelE/ParE family toxin [Bacteroidia bacterium]
MIQSFRSNSLKKFFQEEKLKGINPQHIRKIKRILARLHAAKELRDCDYPGSGLHPLKGNYEGFWAITVNGNWRIVFRFEAGNVYDVEYIDYH